MYFLVLHCHYVVLEYSLKGILEKISPDNPKELNYYKVLTDRLTLCDKVLKDHPRFSDSLEGLTGLSIYTTIITYNKRIQSQITKEKRHME